MASLANQTISSTYDGLVKTSTDQPVPISGVQLLEDGVGNSLALSVGRANQGVTVTGPLTGTLSATSVLADGVTATTQATSDNSTKVATTAFVKSVVTAEDLDIAGDSGTGAVDLDSQTLTIEGTANEIETSASGQTITIGLPSTITANVTGDVSGNLTGNVTGNVSGNVTGDLTGTILTAAQTNITSVGTLSSLAVSGNLTVDTNTLFVDAASNRVGIGTSSPGGISSGATVLTIKGSVTDKGGAIRLDSSDDSLGSFLYMDSSNGLRIHTATNHPIRFSTNGAVPTMGVNTSGNLYFNNGKGIDFGATEGGGATSSLLDDYEEGTWTPAITFGGNSVGVTYSVRLAQYTKIGRQVTASCYVLPANKGTSTGKMRVEGLPYNVGGDAGYVGGVNIVAQRVVYTSGIVAFCRHNTDDIDFYDQISNSSFVEIDNNDLNNNSELIITAIYQTA